jgi:hypothetical protein
MDTTNYWSPCSHFEGRLLLQNVYVEQGRSKAIDCQNYEHKIQQIKAFKLDKGEAITTS